MNVLTLRIKSWRDARILADELSQWIFRGQQDASWTLSTALERAGQQGQETNFLLTQIENQITEEFQRRAHHFLSDAPPLENLIEWLALIQHFGGPTRLLDFTNSFYVAAFFAVETASSECAIWCVNHYALFKALGPLLNVNIEEALLPYWKVSHTIGRIAESLIKHQSNTYGAGVFEVQPFRLNERLAVRQGLFLCPISLAIPFMQSLTATFGLQPWAFKEAKTEDYDVRTHGKSMLAETAVIKVLLPPLIHHDVLVLLRYVLWTTRDSRFGAAISANSGPCEQEILDLTSRPRQGPPRSFFYYARFPG